MIRHQESDAKQCYDVDVPVDRAEVFHVSEIRNEISVNEVHAECCVHRLQNPSRKLS